MCAIEDAVLQLEIILRCLSHPSIPCPVDVVMYAILPPSSKKHTAETYCENDEKLAELLSGNTKNSCVYQERQRANNAGEGYFYID